MPLRYHLIVGHDSGLQPLAARFKRVSSGAVGLEEPHPLSLCPDDLIPARNQRVWIPPPLRVDVHPVKLLAEYRDVFPVGDHKPGDAGLSEPGSMEFLRVLVQGFS